MLSTLLRNDRNFNACLILRRHDAAPNSKTFSPVLDLRNARRAEESERTRLEGSGAYQHTVAYISEHLGFETLAMSILFSLTRIDDIG